MVDSSAPVYALTIEGQVTVGRHNRIRRVGSMYSDVKACLA